MPPTAIPEAIYKTLLREIQNGDRHSSWIRANKVGILRGATRKKAAGVIDEDQEKEIISIVDQAQLADFRPLVFLIPAENVTHRLIKVPPSDRAHPMSIEYRIEDLPRNSFEIIQPSEIS